MRRRLQARKTGRGEGNMRSRSRHQQLKCLRITQNDSCYCNDVFKKSHETLNYPPSIKNWCSARNTWSQLTSKEDEVPSTHLDELTKRLLLINSFDLNVVRGKYHHHIYQDQNGIYLNMDDTREGGGYRASRKASRRTFRSQLE